MLQRIAIGVEYDGSEFYGWQSQKNHISVQATIEKALETFTQTPTKIHVAGRTDKGVHAICQVAHFDTNIFRENISWVRGINAILGKMGQLDIRILWAKTVSKEFHARFCATARTYIYKLKIGTIAPACFRNNIGFCLSLQKLNYEEMLNSCQYLIGQHDFSSFRASECQAKTPIKNIYEINILDEYPYYTFTLKADAFLHHMVRNIMAAFIAIGKNQKPAIWLQDLLAQKSREYCPPTFMPNGLYLAKIDYDEIWGLNNTN